MAIVSDRNMMYEKQLNTLKKQIDETGSITEAQHLEMSKLQMMIEEEENKVRRYQVENIRRKHNYLPLIMELLKILAKEGKLMPLYEKAKETALKKKQQKTGKTLT